MRDNFSKQILDILAMRVGVRCSNPSCRKLTTGPRTDQTKIINIGVGSHITAASPRGPRYNSNLSNIERKSYENGIWLCQNCAKLVDNDNTRYTADLLRKWKEQAELEALKEIEKSTLHQSNIINNYIDIEIKYIKNKIQSDRHDYILEVYIKNLGIEPVENYHIDLQMPAKVIEKPDLNPLYVKERSNNFIFFFRVANKGNNELIYPGDKKLIIKLPYFMNNINYNDKFNLFKEPVRITFYRKNFQILNIEKPFDELQCF